MFEFGKCWTKLKINRDAVIESDSFSGLVKDVIELISSFGHVFYWSCLHIRTVTTNL